MEINYDKINSLDKALNVIHKLNRGLENCCNSNFAICEKCGEIYTKGYICWNCYYDNSIKEQH